MIRSTLRMVEPSPGQGSEVARLQAAHAGVDRVDAGRALARLENALFARGRTTSVGRYTLLTRLGQGGAGVVWLAHDPKLERRVAIKLLRREMFADAERSEAHRRLIREARALAHLSHPNVVEVYGIEHAECGGIALDGGIDAADRFDLVIVMEYIEGLTLARWLEAEPRSVAEILAAFLAAGQGLAAVHDLGLVHRDFKPANVMVGADARGAPRVKVLDFGLAGVASRTGMHEHEVTGDGIAHAVTQPPTVGSTTTIGGTPIYMAPEQHVGAALDARTDQFAFCVSLWSALYGALPFVGTSLQALALAKRTTALRLPRRTGVPRALGRVLLRGLAVDPADRWPSMRALLAAITRARAPARGGVAALALLPVLAIGWLARTDDPATCEDVEARLTGVWDPATRDGLREHLGARAGDESDLPAVLDARLDDYAQRWSGAWRSSCVGVDAPVHDARIACLERARGELAAFVEAQRRVDSRGLDGALEAVAALPPVERCLELERAAKGPPTLDDPAGAALVAHVRSTIALSVALGRAGDHAQALATARDALARARELGWPPLRADALQAVASIELAQGEYAAAEADLREAYFDAVEGGHDVGVVHVASELVFVVGYRLARHDEGREWARHAEARLDAPGVEPLDEAALRNSIGAMLEDAGSLDEAAAQYERALELMEAERGPEHPDVATLHNNLGNLAEKRGDFRAAEAAHRRALDIRVRVLGEDDEMTAMSWNNLGIALHRQGRSREAEPHFRRALDVRERVLGEDHPLVARTHMNLGVALKNLERMPEAEEHLRRAMAIFERSLGPSHPDLANAWLNLANVLRRTDRLVEALAAVDRARSIYETTLPAEHPLLARADDFESEIEGQIQNQVRGPMPDGGSRP